MALSEGSAPGVALAHRLRDLRESRWPDHPVTQAQLAEALAISAPLISSWENPDKDKHPTVLRLDAYARFFATRRSVATTPFRVFDEAELTDDERTARDALLRELSDLRAAALRGEAPRPRHPATLWRFADGYDITVVCAQLPEDVRGKLPYTDPTSPDYVELYTYADLDALIELYGHLRATNPDSQVNFRTAPDLTQDDYTTHLVLLGGVDWNVVTRDLLERVDLPVQQVARVDTSDVGAFLVGDTAFQPVIHGDPEQPALVEDVGHFYRGPNPFNKKRSVTICNGMFGRGVVGAVRALTDAKFRDRNEGYARERFGDTGAFSILMRVPIVNGKTVTPDWTVADTRLHEWPEARA